MPLQTGVFDADSHVMETAEWLPAFADPAIRGRLRDLGLAKAGSAAEALMAKLPATWEGHRALEIDETILTGAKGWLAPGALDSTVRSRVLDALEIAAQLVFPTFSLTHFADARDPDVVYGGATALNRAITAFCADDPRLKAVGFVPMNDPEQSVRAAAEAIALGVSAVWLPSEATGGISPSHVAYDPLWATLQDAGVPLVLHIGGGKLLDKVFHDNGHPRPTDWLGGGENLRAKDFPVMHHSPERFLTCLVLDGVLDRFPGLRIGVIELGASWVPGMLRNLDHAHTSFGRSEPLLQGLSLKPSEFVRRQVRFTPFPFEDAGWLVDQAGPELFMFSTDYPHPEGGRRPYERFTESLAGHDEATLDRFFRTNGFELLGLG